MIIANVRYLITFAPEKSIPALVKAGYENDAHLHHIIQDNKNVCRSTQSVLKHGHKILWNKHASSGNK